MSDNLRGAAWILLSCVAATLMSLGIKALAGLIHSMEIVFVRCALGLVLILPVVLSKGMVSLSTRRLKLHLVRGVMAIVGINCGFYSLTVLPLATATTLFFTAPLFVTVFAGPVLGERVGWRRWSATGVGFLGVLFILRPGAGAFEPAMLFAIASSMTFAMALVLSKRLSSTESPTTMLFYLALIAGLGSLPPALTVWVWPTAWEWLLLVVVGVFATARSYFDIKGYAAGEASFVAPFQYFRLLLIGIGAYWLFGEVPQGNALLGAAVIIASTLYIAEREIRLKRQQRKAEALALSRQPGDYTALPRSED